MVNTRSDNEHRLLLIPRNVVDTTNRTQYVHDFSAYEEINKGEDLLHYAEQECQRFISQSSSKQRWVTYIEHEYMDGEAAAGYLFNGLAHMGYDISIIDQYTTIWDLFKRKHIFKAVTASRLILNQKRSRKLIAQLIFTIITPLLALLAEKISLIVDINDATDSVTLRIIIYITILGLVILQLLQLKKKWSEEDRAAVDEHLKKIYTAEYQAFINHLPDQFTMMRDRLVIVNEWNNCDPVIRKVLHAMITYEIEQEYSIESDPLLLYIFLPIGYEKPPKGRLWRENVVSLVPLTYQEKEDIVSAFDLSIDKTTLKTCGADVLYKSQIRLNTSIEFPASYTLLNNYLKELLDAYGSNFKFKKYNALYLIIKLSALYGRYFSEDDAIKLLRYQGNGMDGIGSICQRYQNECLGVDSIKNIRNFFHKVFEIVNKYTGDEYFETFFEGKTILVRFKPLFLYCFENVHFAALGLRQDINIWLLSIVLSEESQWSYCVYASRDYLNITADSSIPAQVIIELTFAILRYSEQRDFYLYHSDILMRIVNIQAVGVIPADRFKQLKDVADRMLFFCPSDNVQDTHLKFLSMLHNKKEKRNGDRQADIPVYLRILDMEKEERARYFYLLSSLECGSTLVLYEILYSLRQEALNFHPNSVYSLIGLYEPPARVEILDKVSSLLDVLTNMLPPTLCESQSAILMLKIRDVIEKFRYQFLAPWFDNDEVSDHYTNRGENGVGYTQKPELIRTYLEASEVLKTLEQELTEKEQNGKDPKEEEIKGLKRHIASIQLKKKVLEYELSFLNAVDELAELSIASRFLPIPLLQMITSILASITFVEVYSLRINSNNVVNIIESLYICKFKDYSRLVKAIITHQWDTEYKLLFLLPIAIEAPYPDEAANDARMFLSEHLDELLKIFNHIIYSRGEKDVNRLFALIITIDNLVLHDHDFTRLLLKSPSVPPDIEKYLSINYLLSECDDLMAFENAVDFLEKIFMLKESILKTVGAEHDGGFLNMLNSTDPKEINDFFGMYRTVCFTAGSDIDRERIAFNIAISNIAELYQDQAFVLLLPYVMKTLLGSSPKACINTFKKYIDHNDEIMKLPNVLAVTMMEYSRIQPDTLMLYPVYKDILYQSKLTCGFHLQVAFIQSDYFDMIQPFEENEIAELFLKVLDGSFFLKESIVEVSLEVLKKLESYENIAKTFELMLKKLTKLYEANQLIIKLNRICHETSNHNNVMRTFDLIANIIKLLLFKNNDTVLDESVFSNQDWFEEADIDYIDCFQNLYAYNPTDQTGDPGMKLNLLYCQMVMAMATNKNNSLERLSKTYGEATIIRVNINNIRWLMDLYKRQFSPDSSTYSLIENSFKQLYYYC